MGISKHRGHKIEYKLGCWIYCDTRELVSINPNRACGYCGISSTQNGYDNCLGKLPGLMNACCGHGKINEMYIQYWNGICIRGIDAKFIIEKLKED